MLQFIDEMRHLPRLQFPLAYYTSPGCKCPSSSYCTIIDLHNRSVIASITDRHIASVLAIRTLQKALDSQPAMKVN